MTSVSAANGVGPVGAGAGLNPIDDVAFAVMALRLQSLDTDIEARITGMHQRIELRKAIQERMKELREYMLGSKKPDDRCRIEDPHKYLFEIDPSTGEVARVPDPNDPTFDASAPRWRIDVGGIPENEIPGREEDAFELEAGRYVSRVGQLHGSGEPPPEIVAWARERGLEIERYDAADHTVASRQTIETEIERLQGLLDGLNADSEIEMMELNRLVNQRTTALQLTTNVLSSVHQSSMGIISNIGK